MITRDIVLKKNYFYFYLIFLVCDFLINCKKKTHTHKLTTVEQKREALTLHPAFNTIS